MRWGRRGVSVGLKQTKPGGQWVAFLVSKGATVAMLNGLSPDKEGAELRAHYQVKKLGMRVERFLRLEGGVWR